MPFRSLGWINEGLTNRHGWRDVQTPDPHVLGMRQPDRKKARMDGPSTLVFFDVYDERDYLARDLERENCIDDVGRARVHADGVRALRGKCVVRMIE